MCQCAYIDEVYRLFFCNADRPWPETSCPVAVTNPTAHPKNKPQPAQSQFFYASSIIFKAKMKVQKDFKN